MKTFNEVRAPKIKKGLRDKKGKIQKVDMDTSGKKLSFKITSEFGDFKTVGVKQLATMFENYRTLATKGMGTETKNSIKVGTEIDFYRSEEGDKRQGKITKMGPKDYIVQDIQNKKNYKFVYHDRVKAKELLK